MEELTRREKLMRKLSNYNRQSPKVGGEVSETINFKTSKYKKKDPRHHP